MDLEKPTVVIDNGSYKVKAGFSCDNHPVSMFRSVVGRPNYLRGSYGREPYEVYVGDEAIHQIEDLEINSPVVRGEIVHWENMERVWHHIYYRELKVAPEEQPAILACSSVATIQEKIKCCEIFFENLNVPELCIKAQSVLALNSSGLSTGVCVDLGYDSTDINPIFEGGLVTYAHVRTGVAGAQISSFIKNCLNDRNLDFGIRTPEVIDGIMRDCLYLTQDCAMSRKAYSRNYKFPNGEHVDVSQEAFMAGEIFFQPDAVKEEETGFLPLQDALVESVMKCDTDLQNELYEGVVLCGGLAMLPCLHERLAVEMEVLINKRINLVPNAEAYAAAWLGAATVAGLPGAKQMGIQKKQYEDCGEKIIRNKFL